MPRNPDKALGCVECPSYGAGFMNTFKKVGKGDLNMFADSSAKRGTALGAGLRYGIPLLRVDKP